MHKKRIRGRKIISHDNLLFFFSFLSHCFFAFVSFINNIISLSHILTISAAVLLSFLMNSPRTPMEQTTGDHKLQIPEVSPWGTNPYTKDMDLVPVELKGPRGHDVHKRHKGPTLGFGLYTEERLCDLRHHSIEESKRSRKERKINVIPNRWSCMGCKKFQDLGTTSPMLECLSCGSHVWEWNGPRKAPLPPMYEAI